MPDAATPSDSPRLTPERRRRIWRFVRPQRYRLLGVLVASIFATLCSLAFPILLQQVIDHGLTPPYRRDVLVRVGVFVVVIGILRFAIGVLQNYQFVIAATHIVFRMRVALFRHLQVLPLAFFSRTRIGEITTRMTRDIAEIQSTATGALMQFVGAALTVTGTVGILIYYEVRLFLASCVILPIAFVVARLFRSRVVESTKEIRTGQEKVSTFLIETVGGVKPLRAAGQDRREGLRFVRLQSDLIGKILRLTLLQSFGGGLPHLLVSIAHLIVLGWGGFMVMNGELTKGALVAFAVSLGRVFGPLEGLIALYLRVQQALVSVDRVFEYLEQPAERGDSANAVTTTLRAGHVRYRDVAFAYDPGTPTLADVDITIPAGSRCAIVGRSGSGKSTLVSLLFRLEEAQSGTITIDDVDIATMKVHGLRRQMAWVSQEPFVLHASLEENVRHARPDAPDEAVARVLEATGLDRLAARLPDGLETRLGDRGFRLSGGEKQRISLARALLAEPKILVLDEATAHLDLASHDRMLQAIDTLLDRPTIIMITHRATGLDDCDQLVLIDAGRIVAAGPPDVVAPTTEAARVVHGLTAPGSPNERAR